MRTRGTADAHTLPIVPPLFLVQYNSDLGCHIDGYIALVAHTAVVDGGDDVTGSKADVVHAAATAVEAAFKLARPGNKSSQIVAAVERIAEEFGVTGVQGTLSQQMKR